MAPPFTIRATLIDLQRACHQFKHQRRDGERDHGCEHHDRDQLQTVSSKPLKVLHHADAGWHEEQ
jgi:hypothetical protein